MKTTTTMAVPITMIDRRAVLFACALAGCGGMPDRAPASTGPERPETVETEGPTARPAPVASGAAEGGTAVATEDGQAPNALDAEYGARPALRTLRGRVSYYSDSLAGNHTANGDIYDPAAFTAASRNLPFGTVVRVVRDDSGRSVLVRINDRGPFRDHQRIMDLSRAAAEALDMVRAGVINARAEVLFEPE